MRAAHVTGFVLWLTGLPAAGKTTIANNVAPELERRGRVVDLLDGDVVRTHLSKGLGYTKADRDVNVARIAWVASRIARAGGVVIVSAISPYDEARKNARSLIEPHVPFGGQRDSGTGWREPGTEALDVYSDWKTVYVTHDPASV